jgi:6-pyruvoyltetrahydropterin/6-carboxytetrahydropterin synthase
MRFEAAHRLHQLPEHHKCHNLHGHSYRVRVRVDGPLDADGMVVEYSDLKSMVESILDPLDHSVLCASGDDALIDLMAESGWAHNVLPTPTTTAEHLCAWIQDELLGQLDGLAFEKYRLGVDVWETESACVSAPMRSPDAEPTCARPAANRA